MKQFYLRILAFAFIFLGSYISQSHAQPGIDLDVVISSPGTIVNEYTFLTADAVTGATFIKVNNSNLNTNSRFSSTLNTGDLIMIIQMQGAGINGTAKDSTWGAITNYNNCGNYEFAEVESVPDANTINLSCFLKNNYTAAGKVQVIRVQRYASLTINAGATITADAWNGTQGGIVAVEVLNNTVISAGGTIDVSGLGFRGGVLQNASDFPNVTAYAVNSVDSAGNKGESVAGYQSDYNKYGGMFGRGAPANGGGGGNSVNTAGGGGANAGNIKTYTGNGNPDTSVVGWKTAWNLEYNGFAKSISSGGGRGGYAWGNASANPLVDGPGSSAWAGDNRYNHGGKGGRPLDYSTGKIFMGGGGGSGQENNNSGGSGGNGGGIVFIISYGSVSGSGSIISNGQNGQDNNAITGTSGDGPGGGGGGGTVIVTARYGINGVSENANGGNGGNQIINTVESEGPGGGGGGYIATFKGSPTRLANAGLNGTTNSSSLVNFIPNGATKGGAGIANAYITPFFSPILNVGSTKTIMLCPGYTITMSIIPEHDPSELPADTLYEDSTYTYIWSPSTYTIGSLTDSFLVTAPPVGNISYIATFSDGVCARKDTFAITVNPNPTINFRKVDSICPGQSVTLNPGDSTSYSYSWRPPTGLSCTNCQYPVATPSTSIPYTVVAMNKYCKDSTTVLVRVFPLPTISFNSNIFCYNQATSVKLNSAPGNTLSWSPSVYLSCTNCNNPLVTLLQDTTYFIKVTNVAGCVANDTFHAVLDRPTVSAGIDTTIVQTTTGILHGSGSVKYAWSPTATLSTPDSANTVASPTVTTTYTVMGTDSLGCLAQASVIIFIESPCVLPVLPNAFSPNGNGKNDVYKMLNPYVDKVVVFSIYNRWGQLVFQTDDENTGWDGTFKGKPQPVDVYEYYLKVICHGQPQEYKGNVTLLR